MTERPQIGEVWANKDRTFIFTVFDVRYDKNGWELDVQVNGESEIRTGYYDRNYKKLEGFTRLS